MSKNLQFNQELAEEPIISARFSKRCQKTYNFQLRFLLLLFVEQVWNFEQTCGPAQVDSLFDVLPVCGMTVCQFRIARIPGDGRRFHSCHVVESVLGHVHSCRFQMQQRRLFVVFRAFSFVVSRSAQRRYDITRRMFADGPLGERCMGCSSLGKIVGHVEFIRKIDVNITENSLK